MKWFQTHKEPAAAAVQLLSPVVREKGGEQYGPYLDILHQSMYRIMRLLGNLELLELSERAEMLLREELPAKVEGLIGEERREELAELKNGIQQEIQRLGARTDRRYLRAAGHLRRNPTAVSKRFRETVEELRRLMDADQRQDGEMQDKGEDK